MPEDHHHFMGLTLEESRLALEAGNSPVGSIIVRDGEVIGRGQNRVNSHADPTCHGETDAIRNACRALGSPDLSGSTLYTAMEPCRCAAGQSSWRISKRSFWARAMRKWGEPTMETIPSKSSWIWGIEPSISSRGFGWPNARLSDAVGRGGWNPNRSHRAVRENEEKES